MANNNVHTGYWIDHSRGPILGATITLDSRYGTQLISAATVVVNIIGVALWSLLAFSLHQRFSQPGLRDEYQAQRQVILRNSTGAETAAWSLFKNGFAWRGRRKGVLKEAILTALLPAVLYGAFIVAGVFVGKIATASYDSTAVLIKSGACGYITAQNDAASMYGLDHVGVNISTVAKQYAQSCYSGGGSASAISCSVYPTPRLNYTIALDQPCPFSEEACFTDSFSSAMTLRTAPIDSHTDMGINAPKQDRLTFEYQATCAPLEYTFVERNMDSVDRFWSSNLNVTELQLNVGQYYPNPQNLTSLFYYRPLVRSIGLQTIGYSLNAFQSHAPHTANYSTWKPSPALASAQGDLDILVIAPNAITYAAPVQDVMFQTYTEPSNKPEYASAPYLTNHSLYVMGCSETYQICNPAKSLCTGWSGSLPIGLMLRNATAVLDLNQKQNATFTRMANLANNIGIYNSVNGIADPLIASTYLYGPTSSQQLPNGFWRTEVEGWFRTALASIQYLQTIFVNVPLDIVQANDIEFQTADSIDPGLAEQCSQQRVTAPARFTNYNFFALVFIGVFGIIIPSIAMTVKFFHQHLPWVNHEGHRYLSYQAEGVMQLHRMATEGAGYTGWHYIRGDEFPRTGAAAKRLPQVVLVRHGEGGDETLRYPSANEQVGEKGEGHESDETASKTGYHEVALSDPDPMQWR